MRSDKTRNSKLLDGGNTESRNIQNSAPEENEFPDGGLGELFSDGTEEKETMAEDVAVAEPEVRPEPVRPAGGTAPATNWPC